MRSAMSAGPSRVVAGMTTAPSFIAASMVSHSGDDVAEHEQDPVAALDAQLAQPVGDLVGPGGQLAVAELRAGVAVGDDPQRGPVGGSRAITSNQSSAQLNSPSTGQENSRRAAA